MILKGLDLYYQRRGWGKSRGVYKNYLRYGGGVQIVCNPIGGLWKITRWPLGHKNDEMEGGERKVLHSNRGSMKNNKMAPTSSSRQHWGGGGGSQKSKPGGRGGGVTKFFQSPPPPRDFKWNSPCTFLPSFLCLFLSFLLPRNIQEI